MPKDPSFAVLSNQNGYTVFSFQNRTLRFKAPNSLERYTKVNFWDNGYLEVMAKYAQKADPIEEYIDLLPILNDLYMDPHSFLKPIKGVEISDV